MSTETAAALETLLIVADEKEHTTFAELLTDAALAMFDKMLGAVLRRADRTHKTNVVDRAKTLDGLCSRKIPPLISAALSTLFHTKHRGGVRILDLRQPLRPAGLIRRDPVIVAAHPRAESSPILPAKLASTEPRGSLTPSNPSSDRRALRVAAPIFRSAPGVSTGA